MEPLTDVRDISRIAYGFIASKALFAALELDLFSRLLEPKTIDALARESGHPGSSRENPAHDSHRTRPDRPR